MKKKFLTLFLLSTILTYSQTVKLENGIFYTFLENGVNQNKKIKFEIDKATIEKIKLSDSYKKTLEDKIFLNNCKTKYKITNPLIAHLFATVNMANFFTIKQVKNKVSIDFIENSKGEIYFNDENELIITFFFKSKNDYGNEVNLKSKYNDNNNDCYITD